MTVLSTTLNCAAGNGSASATPLLKKTPMPDFLAFFSALASISIDASSPCTAPPLNAEITAVPFAHAPLYAILPESHAAINKEHLGLEDLADDEWILFPKRLQPIVHEAILAAARRDGIRPKCTHDAVTAEQAIHLVSEQVGVGIVTKPNAFDSRPKNAVLKPFSDKSLRFETCVIMRKGDDSRLTNQFVRTLLRKFNLASQPGSQMELSLSA